MHIYNYNNPCLKNQQKIIKNLYHLNKVQNVKKSQRERKKQKKKWKKKPKCIMNKQNNFLLIKNMNKLFKNIRMLLNIIPMIQNFMQIRHLVILNNLNSNKHQQLLINALKLILHMSKHFQKKEQFNSYLKIIMKLLSHLKLD